MRKSEAEQQEYRDRLKADFLVPGDTLHLVLRHRARSGMLRRISVLKLVQEEHGIRVYQLDHLVAKALGWSTREGEEGVVVHGCGMDMGMHTVYELSAALFGDGYALKHQWL